MDVINNQISILYRLSQTYLSKKLKVYGLSHSQIATILYLASHEDVQQNHIVEHLSLDKGSVSSMIKKMVSNGYVKKLTSPTDKRATLLMLTYKSDLMLNQISEANQNLANNLLDGFDRSEKKVISEYLQRMQHNAELIESLG